MNEILESATVGDQFKIALVGVSSLQYFVALNWTGQKESAQDFKLDCFENVDNVDAMIADSLDSEGEGLYPVIKTPELLMLSKLILIDAVNTTSSWIVDFWRLRCLWIHQECSMERSEKIHAKGIEIINKTSEEIEELEYKTLFNIEASNFFSEYYEIAKMKHHSDIAFETIGMKIKDVGALGKRTKFQQNDLSQFTIDIEKDVNKSELSESFEICDLADDVPKDLRLDDELRLDKIKFREGRPALNLNVLDQIMTFNAFIVKLRSQPKDALMVGGSITLFGTRFGKIIKFGV